MSWQISFLLFSAVFELSMLLVLRGRLRGPVAGPFLGVLLLNTLWAFNYAIDLSSPSAEEKLWLLQLRSTFLPFYALAWFETAYRFALGRPFLRGGLLAAALVVPGITAILVWLPGGLEMVYRTPWLDTSGSIPLLRVAPTPWAHVYNVFNYVVGGAAMVIVLRTRLRGQRERVATFLFMTGALAGIVADALYELDLSPTPGLNYAPLILPITSGLIAIALMGDRVFDLAPVARAAVIERIDDRLLVFDLDGRLADLNAAAGRDLGGPAAKWVGRPASEVLAPWPGAHAILLAAPEAGPRELRVGERDFEVAVFDLKSDDNIRARARVLSLREITGRKRIEEELRLAKEAAEAAEAAQARFLAMMSHEIRTPLNGMLGFADLLASTPLPPEQREYVDLISQSGRSLLVIVNDVLDYSKIAAGQLDLERTPCDIGQVVARVCGLLERQAHMKGVSLTGQVDPSMPDRALGDPVRIGQILTNLVGNAIKFTETGGVRVSATYRPESANRGIVELAVSDTGIGISVEHRARIFLPFSQADASTTRRFGGTGLGLAISRTLCERMGGRLTLESEPGRGSTFTVTIPVELAPPEKAAGPAVPEIVPAGRSLRVLVFEDNLVNQAVTRALLRRLGHRSEFVGDGVAGLERLEREKFDLILMDIEMPVMDGYEAVRHIRERERDQPYRHHIVALTAHALKGERERCLAAGMDDFLTKPVSLQALKDALARANLPDRGPEAAQTSGQKP